MLFCTQDSSSGAGAGYEQDVQQFKLGNLKQDAKKNAKKVGSTINKKANQAGAKVGTTTRSILLILSSETLLPSVSCIERRPGLQPAVSSSCCMLAESNNSCCDARMCR